VRFAAQFATARSGALVAVRIAERMEILPLAVNTRRTALESTRPSSAATDGSQQKREEGYFMEQKLEQFTSKNPLNNPQNLPGDRIRTVTGATFAENVIEGEGPIAVEFMSYGCSYCRALEPAVQKVAEMIESQGKIFRVNVAVEQELAAAYKIQATPTLVMFLNGRKVGIVEGLSPTVSSVLTAVTHPFQVKK
jgi:thioredoxin 1